MGQNLHVAYNEETFQRQEDDHVNVDVQALLEKGVSSILIGRGSAVSGYQSSDVARNVFDDEGDLYFLKINEQPVHTWVDSDKTKQEMPQISISVKQKHAAFFDSYLKNADLGNSKWKFEFSKNGSSIIVTLNAVEGAVWLIGHCAQEFLKYEEAKDFTTGQKPKNLFFKMAKVASCMKPGKPQIIGVQA